LWLGAIGWNDPELLIVSSLIPQIDSNRITAICNIAQVKSTGSPQEIDAILDIVLDFSFSLFVFCAMPSVSSPVQNVSGKQDMPK